MKCNSLYHKNKKTPEPPPAYSGVSTPSPEFYTQEPSADIASTFDSSNATTEEMPLNDHDIFIHRMIRSRSSKVAPIARKCNFSIRKCQRWWKEYTTDNELYKLY